MVIFTSICANYLHKARTLADSVKLAMPEAYFVVCLLEREISDSTNHPSFDEVVLAKDVWEEDFERFIFKHSIVEAATAVKAQFFRYLYTRFPEENELIYLDPDIYVYSEFAELSEILKIYPIAVCPHLTQPGNIQMELSATAHGIYNLGFLAINNTQEAKRFIDWWAERLLQYCYADIENGVFTDQKWIDLAPCFFDVHIIRHRGYDFATWSLLDCDMIEARGQVFVKDDPLRFIHYSGYGITLEDCMKRWLPAGEHAFRKLYRKYCEKHDKNDSDKISKTPWSYDFYISGEKIDTEVRVCYRQKMGEMAQNENPFYKSNRYYQELFRHSKSRKIYSKAERNHDKHMNKVNKTERKW